MTSRLLVLISVGALVLLAAPPAGDGPLTQPAYITTVTIAES